MSLPLPTIPPNTLPPLLRLATELHLVIISFLPDLKDAKDEYHFTRLQLRRTNHYFRDLVPPPTHSDLLSLELVVFGNSVYACKFCLRLRPAAKFASKMLKGKTGFDGNARDKRFCADCGFDTTVVGQSQRYCPSTRVSVSGVDWVWCKRCKFVKKGEEADSICTGLCKACYKISGCRCNMKCKGPPLDLEASRPPRGMLPEASWGHTHFIASDEYDFWEEQFELAQLEDDDWRTL